MRRNPTPSHLVGLGIDLYFKSMKVWLLVFFAVSVLSLAPLLGYWRNSELTAARRDASVEARGPSAAFFALSVGSLGQYATVCGSAEDGETVELSCPAHYEIQEVFARGAASERRRLSGSLSARSSRSSPVARRGRSRARRRRTPSWW
mgnify:CR=1 FL=1